MAASRCLFSASFRRRRELLCLRYRPITNIAGAFVTTGRCLTAAKIGRTNFGWTCGDAFTACYAVRRVNHQALVATPGYNLEVWLSSAVTYGFNQSRTLTSTTNSSDGSKSDGAEGSSEDEKARRQAEENKKKIEFQKKATKYTVIALGVALSFTAGSMISAWGAPPTDEDGNTIKDKFSDLPTWKAYLYRTWSEMIYYDKMIKEPSRDKLLPDPLQEPYYQPPFTLVIELTGVLVHPDWTYKTGWRFKKRPGVGFFLHQAGPPLFEVVVFTFEQGLTAFPIIDSLDPDGCVMYRLFRDATRYVNGHHVKDLSCLNRDLSRVIFVDWNEKSFQLQPENALKLKKWTGSDDDTALFDLAMFLRTIATSDVEDVRTVLSYYKQFDDPLQAFKDNQRRLQEEQDRLNLQQLEQSDKPKTLTGSWSSGLFGRRR